MKFRIVLALAAFALSGLGLANPGGHSSPGRSPSRPSTLDPVNRDPGGNKNTPSQPRSGADLTPTPVPIQRKINVVTDLELSIVPGEKSFDLHVLSSLPVRSLLATDRNTGTDLADVKLDDAIDFTVTVDGQPNSAVALTLEVNLGLYKGKPRIRKAYFDLFESAQSAVVEKQVSLNKKSEAEKVKEKDAATDEPLPAELTTAPAPE